MIVSNERLLKTKEVAKLLSISPITVCAHVAHGLLKVHDRVGTAMLFAESEVARFERERRKPGNPNFVKSGKTKLVRKTKGRVNHAAVQA